MTSPARRSITVVAGVLIGTLGAVLVYRNVAPSANGSSPSTAPTAAASAADAGDDGRDGETGAASGDASAEAAAADLDASPGDAATPDEPEPATLEAQRERLFAQLAAAGGVTAEELARVRAIFAASPYLGQGNPAITVHPMTRAQCRERRAKATLAAGEPGLCGKKNMVPIFDPAAGESKETARVCIDQYEFPDIPCEYPVVNVQANEAADICRAVGKRLCDAHEWEGGCAGALRSPDVEYSWKHDRRYSSGMHNLKRELVWAYGPKKDHGLCATSSSKSKSCPGGGWKQCGSNTYPTGAFPECKSRFGVYDQHGNAAEHMNLPLRPEDMMSRGTAGGVTEMKGSWFIFSRGEPHLDDCRWREPSWHESRVSDPGSHRNYHLGFRCCKDR